MRRLLLLLPLLFSPTATAQLPQITLTGIYPAGAQRGTSLDVTVTSGTDLDEATELLFSHPGLTATARLDGNGNPITNRFLVSVDPGIEPGLYDVRLRGLFGISNPRLFVVDTIPEVVETEPNNTSGQSQKITLNTTVNGRSDAAADVDTFQFSVESKQTIVIRSTAASLDSLMQPVLELYDGDGRRVAHSRRRQQQDAVIVYTSDDAQTLELKVHDTVYAGGNTYPYRISVDTRPQVDFVQPAIMQAGLQTDVRIFGRNIPGGQPTGLTIDHSPLLSKSVPVILPASDLQSIGTNSAASALDTCIYSGIDGNLVRFAIGPQAAHQPEKSPEEKRSPAQTVTLPASVSGSFAHELDEDVYRFSAKKGEVWLIDVLADRLGSTADPLLLVEQVTKDGEGNESFKRLGREESNRQNPGGNSLPTLTKDPSFQLTVPADGDYQVKLKDRYSVSRGAADMTYSITITKPKRDFRIVLFDSLPSADGKAPPATGAISLRKGGTYQIPVYAYRSGGHNDDIQISSANLPAGIQLSNATIPAGKSSTTVVLTASADAKELASFVQLTASSGAGDQKQDRPVTVATLVHAGANGLPRTGRVSGSLMVGVMKDEQPIHVLPGLQSAEVSQDQQLLVPIKLTRRTGFDDKVDIVFSGQPKNVDVPKVSIAKGQDSVVARFYFKDNVATGPSTLLMYATAQVPYKRNPWQVDRANQVAAQAEEGLKASAQSVEAARAAAESSAAKVVELANMLKTLEQQLVTQQASELATQAELKKAIAGQADANRQLVALQVKLSAAVSEKTPKNVNVDNAIKNLREATLAVNEAARPIADLSAKLKTLTKKIAANKKAVADRTLDITQAKSAVAKQQIRVETAKKAMAAAEAKVKLAEAAKKAAADSVKKAEAAAKPQNKNVRTIAVPIRVVVHLTPGKITATVPGGGAIKKDASAEVKVTLARKNKFAGAVKLKLQLSNGESRVTSSEAEIAADGTEATLKLTAKADTAAGDIVNAVIRATGDFNGRKASFDAPITLKVTD